MVEKRMTAEAVIEAARKLEVIKRLDQEIGDVCERFLSDDKIVGSRFRQVVGQNVLVSLRDDVLAQVVQHAIINALMEKRAAVASEIEGFITVPACPYLRSTKHAGPQDG